MACLPSWKHIALLLIFVCRYSSTSIPNANISNETRLIQFLLQHKQEVLGPAASYTRPIQNDGPLYVQGQVALQKLIDLDVKEQTITLQVYLYLGWYDDYMKWNPTDFGNITQLIWLSTDQTWIPDYVIYNAVEVRSTYDREVMVIDNRGECYLVPNIIVKIPCQANIREFPFDVHSCKLSMGSWGYSDKLLHLSALDKEDTYDAQSKENQQWEVIGFEQSKTVINDSCCEGVYSQLTYTITLKRKATFFFFVLILPACLLNALVAILFLLPTDFPDKISIGLSIFLSYIVLLIVLVDATPSAGTSLPILGEFYCVSICISSAAIFASVLVYNIHHCTSVVSNSAQRMIANFGQFLCVRTANNFIQETNSQQGLSSQSLPLAYWSTLAQVLNRLFLFVYICITLAIAVLFLA